MLAQQSWASNPIPNKTQRISPLEYVHKIRAAALEAMPSKGHIGMCYTISKPSWAALVPKYRFIHLVEGKKQCLPSQYTTDLHQKVIHFFYRPVQIAIHREKWGSGTIVVFMQIFLWKK